MIRFGATAMPFSAGPESRADAVPGSLGTQRPLRVGLNLLFLGARAGGVGRYARELPGALLQAEPATLITVFCGSDLPAEVRAEPWAAAVRWVSVPVAAGTPGSQLAQYLLLPARSAARRLDVLHSPANAGPAITPRVASVVSLMDLIWRQHADDWNPDPAAQRAMGRWVSHSVRHADRVLAITHAAAREIVADLGVSAGRITVTPLGVRSSMAPPTAAGELRRDLELGDARILLCIAQKRRYKHLEALVRALPSLPADIVLVCPGSSTAYESELRRLAVELAVTERVRFPDWVSESDLAGLYRTAAAFALPSLSEGFGLPVLEAMAQGLPVACSDIPALLEVTGDAALHFDPRDQSAVDAALARLLGDDGLRATLIEQGRRQVSRFSWRATGAATLAAYREAIAVHSKGHH